MNPQEVANELAMLLTRMRMQSHGIPPGTIFPDGSHNPMPHEIQESRKFIQGMVTQGWTPPIVVD